MKPSLSDFIPMREEIVMTAQRAYQEGLMAATSGNLSCFDEKSGYIAITPSGMDYSIMKPDDIVIIDLDGNVIDGIHKPSSEWKMHAEIYRHLPQHHAIVHTHSPSATAYAVLRREIPCVLVEMLLFLGGSIEVAEYAAQGSAAVGTNCLPILSRKPACLLANHGVVTVGDTLAQAYTNSVYVEDSAKIVQLAMSTGCPIPAILDKEGSKPYHE
ncbi:MAG: class II aldolase/adducin family protein [Clostridia bacterium]|nr:class II aldolase/adducin family protein [Clostridia bacterium]